MWGHSVHDRLSDEQSAEVQEVNAWLSDAVVMPVAASA